MQKFINFSNEGLRHYSIEDDIYILILPELKEYILYNHWDLKMYDLINKVIKTRGKDDHYAGGSYILDGEDHTNKFGVGFFIPYKCAKVVDKDHMPKERTKIRRSDIDPFDEEDWGYVQESLDDNVFEIGDRVICNLISTKISKKSGTIIEIFSKFNKKILIGVEFDDNVGGHSCDGQGKLGHCFYLPATDFLKIEDGKKRTKIRRPDIDPFDEEDWGYIQESVIYGKVVLVSNKYENDNLMRKLGQAGYTWASGTPLSVDRHYSLPMMVYLENDKTIARSEIDTYEKSEKGHYILINLKDLDNIKIPVKIRRPDIDPFDEEDWGYEED